MKTCLLAILLLICSTQMSYSQEEDGVVSLALPIRNSLRFNRFIVNPTFSFVREQNKYVSITNKREWVQFEDAPQTYIASYSGRFSENTGVGVGLFQQNYGVLTTFGGIVNFAYNVRLDRDSNLTFGMNVGAYKSGLNSGSIVTNFPDPSLQNIPSNFLLTINPGINYGTGFMDFGVAINNLALFNTSNIIENNPEQSIQAHIMYTGYTDSGGFLDESRFSGLIRSEFKKDKTVISGIAMLMVPKGIWAQIGYNNLYGASAGLGLNITKQIAIEYNFEKAMGDLTDFGPSHEITLAYKFKNSENYDYSREDEVTGLISGEKKRKPVSSISKLEADANRQLSADNKVKAKLEADAKAEQAAILKADAEAAKLAEAAKAKETADANEKIAADNKAKEEEKAKEDAKVAALAAEVQAKEVAEGKAKIAAENTAKAVTDAKARTEAVTKANEDADRKAKLTEQLRAKMEAEQKAAAVSQTKLEADRKAKIDAAAILLAEKNAKAEKDAQAKKEAEATLAAETKAKLDAAIEAKLEAEAKAKLDAENKAKLEAERQAKIVADAAAAKLIADKNTKAEEDARMKKEAAATLAAETKAKTEAEAKAKLDAENKAKLEAERQAKIVAAAAAAKLVADQNAKAEKDAQAKKEAAATLAAETKAKVEAENKAKVAVETEAKSKAEPTDALGKSMVSIEKLTDDSQIAQKELLTRFSEAIDNKNKDLKELKEENDLSDKGVYMAPKPFKSLTEENNALDALKTDLDAAINTRNQRIKELETLYDQRVRIATMENDTVNLYYQTTIKRLKAEQLSAIQNRATLTATLDNIKSATEIERKRRIKRAAYDSEQDKYNQDRATLSVIKQNTKLTSVPLKTEDFDFGEEQSNNIQILKNVKNVDNGYYLILAVHNDIAKRDEFLTKTVASGRTDVDFFYDVNTSKYYIYYQKFNNIEDANEALKLKGNRPYNVKLSIAKIEN